MNMLRIVPTAILVAALAACTSTAPRYESDPAVDFSAYHAFAWRATVRSGPPANPLDSELLEKRVRSFAAGALTARGFAASDAPQFTLRSALLAKPGAKDGGSHLSVGFGLGSFGRSSASSISIGAGKQLGGGQAELTLLIEVHDARSDELAWQGWCQVSERIGDANDPELERAVRTILADFPPHQPRQPRR